MKNELEIMIPVTKDQQELMEKMRGEIRSSRIKAVSFKLFGTLVQYPFSELDDLFYLLEREFPKVRTSKQTFPELRVYAEDEAKKAAVGKCSPKINEVYAVIAKKAKLSPEETEEVLKRECELAVKYAFPRNFGRSLYGDAVRDGKRTIITADTIYPRSTVVKILSRCGYEGCTELLVTNELEHEGDENTAVYSGILKKSNVPADRLIHIGGNVVSDVETPILGGSKALLMAETVPAMVRSGRMRAYIQAKNVFNYDTADCLPLHFALGLYAAYIFDIPRQKQALSDFCGSAYLLGFAVFGTLGLLKSYAPLAQTQRQLISAAEENEDIQRGARDMQSLFARHFGDLRDLGECSACSLPLEFLADHGAPADRAMFADSLDTDAAKQWETGISDPVLAPVYGKKRKKNAAAKLADRMFPPGTRVRNIADSMLIKMKAKTFKK